MSRHVVFGTGQVGRLVVEQLVARGVDVIAVNRQRWAADRRRRRRRRRRHRRRLHHAGHRRRRRRLLLPQRLRLRPLGRRVPAAAAGRARRRRGGRRPPRRARQPLRLRPDRTAATSSRRCRRAPTSTQGGDPGGDDRRPPRCAPRRRRRGGHRAGVGLLRPGHEAVGVGRDRLRRRAGRPRRPGDGPARPAAQLLLHARRRRWADHPGHRAGARPEPCGTCRSPRRARPARSSTTSTARPATDHAASPPARSRSARSAPSSRRCASTATRSTSSPQRWVVDDTKFRTAFGDDATPLDDALDDHPRLVPDTPTDSRKDIDHGHPDHPPARRRCDGRRRRPSPSPGSPRSARSSTTRPILEEPTAEILAAFRRHEAAVIGWFLVLTISAGLLAPIGDPARTHAPAVASAGGSPASASPRRRCRSIGLSRWVLLVPGISDDAIRPVRPRTPTTRSSCCTRWLGEYSARRIGYALTATFTVLVVIGVTQPHRAAVDVHGPAMRPPRSSPAASLIPLGVEAASITNFIGYVVWCLWLIAMAVVLWRHRDARLR